MEREDFSAVLAKLRERVEEEHAVFKCRMLSQEPAGIYDSCTAIAFHECIHTYFLYAEHISPRHVEACQGCGDVAASLYHIYLECGHTRFSTWDDIRELLDIMADRQGKNYKHAGKQRYSKPLWQMIKRKQ